MDKIPYVSETAKGNVRRERRELDLEIDCLERAIAALRELYAQPAKYGGFEFLLKWIRIIGGRLEVSKTKLAELKAQYPDQDKWLQE